MSEKDQQLGALVPADPDSDPVHARVRAALGETGASLAPRPGWEAKVWARIEAGEQAEPSVVAAAAARRPAAPRWGWFASGAMLAAAAVALLVWQPWSDGGGGAREPAGAQVAVAPTLTIRPGAQVMRGSSDPAADVLTAAPGDTLEARHHAPGTVFWIYRDGALLVEGGARLDVLLEQPGTYHVIGTAGPRAAPEALDAALAALLTDGAAHSRDVVEVR